ncbi:hypothetical protein AQ790_28275 [Burkholderia pseudomallei]|nr:hypothetical protein AQ790_28275 [Burkholderia pseudomallei]
MFHRVTASSDGRARRRAERAAVPRAKWREGSRAVIGKFVWLVTILAAIVYDCDGPPRPARAASGRRHISRGGRRVAARPRRRARRARCAGLPMRRVPAAKRGARRTTASVARRRTANETNVMNETNERKPI